MSFQQSVEIMSRIYLKIEIFLYASGLSFRNLSLFSEGFPTCLPDRRARFARLRRLLLVRE